MIPAPQFVPGGQTLPPVLPAEFAGSAPAAHPLSSGVGFPHIAEDASPREGATAAATTGADPALSARVRYPRLAQFAGLALGRGDVLAGKRREAAAALDELDRTLGELERVRHRANWAEHELDVVIGNTVPISAYLALKEEFEVLKIRAARADAARGMVPPTVPGGAGERSPVPGPSTISCPHCGATPTSTIAVRCTGCGSRL